MSYDAVEVAPNIYEVMFENERVRVLDVAGDPGARSPMHHHPDSVVHVLADATIRLTSGGGVTSEASLHAGSTFWSDESMHAVEVVGEVPVRLIRIELK
jgi:quercetin dioxygenase-like cupin family protein